jgi:Family of unknown function (DUF6364)
MITKLTLSLDDAVISAAKKYAQKEEKSLSGIVENYLMTLTSKNSKAKQKEALSAKVLKLKGSLKLPKDFDYKKELGNALAEKYKI